MPGTTRRACSSRTNVFQAAMNGRGSIVRITVSSMSLTSPNVASGSGTKIRARAWRSPWTPRTISCQPGGNTTGTVRSMNPPRSVTVSNVFPLTVTLTGTLVAGAVTNARQPRTT